jgi:NDP-sugar pyrophosphorylase family protein
MYCKFDWSDFGRFHNSHDMPATLIAAKSCPVRKAAVFDIDGDVIKSWKRAEISSATDFINMGAYIFDGTEELVRICNGLTPHTEDVIFEALIQKRLLAAYCIESIGFNINEESTYKALEEHCTTTATTIGDG